MLVWVPEELLEFAIYDGMRGVSLPGPKRGRLTEEERRRLAEAVMTRIRLCNWRVVRRDVPAHSTFGPPLGEVTTAAHGRASRWSEAQLRRVDPSQ